MSGILTLISIENFNTIQSPDSWRKSRLLVEMSRFLVRILDINYLLLCSLRRNGPFLVVESGFSAAHFLLNPAALNKCTRVHLRKELLITTWSRHGPAGRGRPSPTPNPINKPWTQPGPKTGEKTARNGLRRFRSFFNVPIHGPRAPNCGPRFPSSRWWQLSKNIPETINLPGKFPCQIRF